MKRSRGRGRRPQNNHNRSFDSAGPDIKIRGTAQSVYEKYLQLARDANSAGDRVQAENYLQHAEHYYRIMMAQAQHQASMQNNGQNQPNGNGGMHANPQQGGNQGGEGYMAPQGSAPSFSLADDGDAEGDEAA